VYNPLQTPLLRLAEEAGARTLSGLPMLIYQGSAAFELWTQKIAPVDIMFETAKRELNGL
jgi:shikimate dehydrogenase